jgi:predicted DNA-binding mobile mystery protein A
MRHKYVNIDQATVARRRLERRLSVLRKMALFVPPRGWIKAIRESLGMTARQLASRMGVAPSRIPVIEKAEITGSTTLRTLRQAAAAMNCAFVYAVVPLDSLDDTLRERAMHKARMDVSRLDETMSLENQELLRSDLDAELRRSVERILSGSLRGLWEEERNHQA